MRRLEQFKAWVRRTFFETPPEVVREPRPFARASDDGALDRKRKALSWAVENGYEEMGKRLTREIAEEMKRR
jgi:hypothetical protein